MADIIFPNTYHDDSFESDAMFKGIDWNNFNQKLAQAKEDKEKEVTNTISIKSFYIRRILRIWPLYFLIVFRFHENKMSNFILITSAEKIFSKRQFSNSIIDSR